jgi:hypothetical protein
MPVDYNNIQWRYFPKFDAPRIFIGQRIAKLNGNRVRILQSIMEVLGMLIDRGASIPPIPISRRKSRP